MRQLLERVYPRDSAKIESYSARPLANPPCSLRRIHGSIMPQARGLRKVSFIGLSADRLLQCCSMADWRQIQARIRKAKNSSEAHAKLSELFQRTRDAMVAWELAAIEEKAAHNEEAGRWYTIAAQRFRRSDWRKKAEEALTRLGLPLPVPGTPASAEPPASPQQESEDARPALALGEIPETTERAFPEAHSQPAGSTGDGNGEKRKRRRGRRGGRGRRRKSPAAPSLPSQAFAQSSPALQPEAQDSRSEPSERASPRFEAPAPRRLAPVEHPAPMLPSDRTAHGRAGDPALASRLTHLESMLRRLIASPLHRLDEADEAPAGPGVFLLSDSDQVTSYYVEACQTLRIGIGNLVRGGRGGKSVRGSVSRGHADTSGLKARLAEHLGINEAKVPPYMKDHCVIRWIQLDDDAPHLAHFAIGVLRTPLNVD